MATVELERTEIEIPDYAAGTAVEHFAWWCETKLVQSTDRFAGHPLILEPWQLDFFSDALAVNDDGSPYWLSVVLVVSRKNGKTAKLGAYGLYHVLEEQGQPEVLLSAGSDKQAGRLFEACVAFVRRNQELAEQVHVRAHIGEIARVDGNGKIIRIPNSASNLDGFNPSLAIVDELHAWTTPKQRRTYASLTTAGAARDRTQVFTITTAGEAADREDSILGAMIDRNEADGEVERFPGLTISRNHEARTLIYNYSAPTSDPREIAKMRLANPASWVSDEYLKRQSVNPELTKAQVLQLHGCVWASGTSSWIKEEWWSQLLVDGLQEPEDALVCPGVDVALVHDTSSIALAWWHNREADVVGVSAFAWSAIQDVVADTFVEGGRIRLDDLEAHILETAAACELGTIAYDPRFFERSAQLLDEEHGLTVLPLHQSSAPMADAYQAFYQRVREGRLVHGGGSTLTTHVLAAKGKLTDNGWRVSKSANRRRIDACVAAVMAVYALEHHAEVSGPWVAAW